MTNLLSNASKFTERGDIKLTLTLLDPSACSSSDCICKSSISAIPAVSSSTDAPPSPGVSPAGVYHVQFRVSDSGIGMSDSTVSRLFQPYSQGARCSLSPLSATHANPLTSLASSSTSRNFGGTGLGLTITKQIIEATGGHLVVDSTEGIGTAFSWSSSSPPLVPPLLTRS